MKNYILKADIVDASKKDEKPIKIMNCWLGLFDGDKELSYHSYQRVSAELFENEDGGFSNKKKVMFPHLFECLGSCCSSPIRYTIGNNGEKVYPRSFDKEDNYGLMVEEMKNIEYRFTHLGLFDNRDDKKPVLIKEATNSPFYFKDEILFYCPVFEPECIATK